MEYYLLMAVAVLGIVGVFVTQKFHQKETGEGREVENALRKSIPIHLFSAVFYFAINGFQIQFSWFSFILAFALGVVTLIGTLVAFRAYAIGSVSLFTVFQMQGGMLLPFIYGVLFANNTLSVWRVIGILLMTFSICIPYIGKKEGKTNVVFIIYCIIMFFLNGSVSILSYVQSNHPTLAVSSSSFAFFSNLVSFVGACVVYLVYCLKNPDNLVKNPSARKCRNWLLWVFILIHTVLNAGSYLLQLICATQLPAVALYPMVTGGTVVLTAICGLLVFKEKLSIKDWTSIILTALATFLFMF